MRLGILGGTFDPVHYGHLLLAESCREQCALDQVLFLPAAVPPHKTAASLSSAQDRIEMLKLAIGGHPEFEVCRYETDRGGVNYTFATLAGLQKEYSDAEFFLLLGADSLRDLPNWREPRRICELATLVVVRRPAASEIDWEPFAGLVSPARLEIFRRCEVEMPWMGISSSEIRRRTAQSRSIRFQTPRAVEKYIQTQGLYRGEP